MSRFLISIFISLYLLSAQFGQNKVQYKKFEWRFIQSKHFDIYFYRGGETLAEYTIEVAESAYVNISRNWDYNLNRRVPIFVYSSHNDFQQSLVVDGYLDEGIGGVTELYKNRIIIPYEGSYDQFKHVIVHELTHSIMNDMLYGGTVQSLISGRFRQVPLWFAEGLAEWESTGWDTKLDMTVRDAIFNNTLPPLDYLAYYYPYQGGCNVFKFIALRFGREKVGELLQKTRNYFDFNNAFESALGMTTEKFTEEWHRYLKQTYLPEIAEKKESIQIAEKLTKHEEDGSYINFSPTFSPKADKLAYFSNRDDGYMSFYLMDLFDNKDIERIIKGNTTNNLEELHFLSPGMSFSPDGKNLAFSAKGGRSDKLYIYNFSSEKIDEFEFTTDAIISDNNDQEEKKLDGIFDAKYSPSGKEIAFVGNKNGSSDIYVYNFETQILRNITNDVFSDINPSWSHDGSKIAFSSDRGNFTYPNTSNFSFKMFKHDVMQRDIYTIDIKNATLQRYTHSDAEELSPVFSPDDTHLAFVSDRNGISNIFLKDIDTNSDEYPITNLLTGAFQLDWSNDGSQLLFTSYFNNGYDIYNLKNPLLLAKQLLKNTNFIETKNKDHFLALSKDKNKFFETDNSSSSNTENDSYSRFNFSKIITQNDNTKKNDKIITLNEEEYKKDGKYKVKDYETKYSMDFVNGSSTYDTFYGFRGAYVFEISDLSGAERISISSNLVFNFKNADLYLAYTYLPNVIDYQIALFHQANDFQQGNRELVNYRIYGINAVASYALTKFERIDFSTQFVNFSLSKIQSGSESKSSSLINTLSYTYDNAKWTYTGPIDGTRFSLAYTLAPAYSSDNVAFQTLKVDFRNYFEFARGFAFASKLSAGSSVGFRIDSEGNKHGAQTFRLGGVENWLFDQKYLSDDANNIDRAPNLENVDELSYSEFIYPLRGAYLNERHGSNYAVANFELRFPFIDYFILRIPPLPLQGIRGNVFLDIGSAFDDWATFRGFEDGNPQDLVVAYGYGLQAYIPYIGSFVRFDTAWRDFGTSVTKPIYYFSFGYDF